MFCRILSLVHKITTSLIHVESNVYWGSSQPSQGGLGRIIWQLWRVQGIFWGKEDLRSYLGMVSSKNKSPCLVVWKNNRGNKKYRESRLLSHILPTGVTDHQMDVTDHCSSETTQTWFGTRCIQAFGRREICHRSVVFWKNCTCFWTIWWRLMKRHGRINANWAGRGGVGLDKVVLVALILYPSYLDVSPHILG